jgi:tetratricopeptide (TPR) repeat protein
MAEFRIWITGHAESHCRIKVETDAGAYEVDLGITAGWKGQLSRLQWKAGALLEEDDAFLAEISTTLAQEIFPESAREIWEPLLRGSAAVLRILYRGQTGVSVLLPLELLSIEGVYFVDIPNLNIVREFDAGDSSGSKLPANTPELRLLHVSWGTDPTLGLPEERSALLGSLPDVPISFLFSPSLDVLRREIARFHPTAVHISSHGSFDIIEERHGTYVDDTRTLDTTTILDSLNAPSVRLVFLASCQSALVATESAEMGRIIGSAEVAGFLFPVESLTAQQMMTTLYRQLRLGSDTGGAIATARNSHKEDVFSSFSLIHIRPFSRHFLSFAAHTDTAVTPIAMHLESSETAIIRFDHVVRTAPSVTLLAPAGFGAETLLHEWRDLQRQAEFLDVDHSVPDEFSFRIGPAGFLTMVRIVRFCDYNPASLENPLILGRLGDLEDFAELHDPDKEQQVRSVGVIAARIPQIRQAILSGASAVGALQQILIENRLDSRVHDLLPQGRKLVEHIVGLGGVSSLTINADHRIIEMDAKEIEDGRTSIIAQRLALELDGFLHLSPEIMCFADALFPEWRSRSEVHLETMAGLFAVIHEHTPLRSEKEVEEARSLLNWSSNLNRWDVFHQLLMMCSPLFYQAGRSSELVPYMETAIENLTGEERMIHFGNLSAHRSQNGDYEFGLKEHRKLQLWFEQNQQGSDRSRNVLAARSQQMDCLIHLGRASEALLELPDILEKTRQWKEAPHFAEAHILGTIGEAYRALGQYKITIQYFTEALKSLQVNGVQGEEELKFLYALSSALLQNDEVYGAAAVFSELERKLPPGAQPDMLSNVYHLKGRLLSETHDPAATKYLLKSLEIDLASGYLDSSLVSLITVAHNAHLDNDRDAVRSFLPKLSEFAAQTQNPAHRDSVRELEAIVSGWNSL